MKRQLRFTDEADQQLDALAAAPQLAGVYKQIRKALGFLELDASHPSLKTHEYTSLSTKEIQVFEACLQDPASRPYCIFFHHGPDEITGRKRTPLITILAIIPRPDE